MRNYFILFLILCCHVAVSQNSKVPQTVSQQLSLSFAKATQIEWTKHGNEKYEAKFLEEGLNKSALFSNSGEILQILTPVSPSALPKNVSNSIARDFSGYNVANAFRVEVGKEIGYRVRIKKGSSGWEVEFDIYGKETRKVEIGEKSKEKDCKGCHKHNHEDDEDGYCERHQKNHKHNHKPKKHKCKD